MSRATYTEIRRAMRRFDWESFLQNAGIDVTQRDIEVGGECPYCHWKRQSFYLNTEKGVFKCHYCGEHGWGVQVVADVLRISTAEAIDRIIDLRASVYEDDPYEADEVELAEPEPEPPPVIEIPAEFHVLANNKSIVARPYMKYALTRMTEDQIERYGVGYCATGRYAERIVVPVTYTGRLVTFVARAIRRDSWKKVDTPPDNEQYSYLFNLERVWGRKRIIITEGVFDALALDDQAVATFGKKVTDTQTILLLNAGCTELVIAWDADAQMDIWNAYLRLSQRFDRVVAIELPEGEDPASLGREEMLRLASEAVEPTEPVVAMREAFGADAEEVRV